jgi:hypothetical protein
MIIIQAYKGKTELTESQKNTLFSEALQMKKQGFTHMYVNSYVPVFACEEILEYVATDCERTRRAIVGKRGGLRSGLGENNKAGYSVALGNDLDMVINGLDKFEHVVTV